MSKYEKLDKYLEKKGKKNKIKEKIKSSKAVKNMNQTEKDELLDMMARDLGYIE